MPRTRRGDRHGLETKMGTHRSSTELLVTYCPPTVLVLAVMAYDFDGRTSRSARQQPPDTATTPLVDDFFLTLAAMLISDASET
ncbi:hypothetical protein BKA82DRAFT_1009203 [Pisolithus tinctorius]|uniref:Uncharacterized protein n=1 Tax=Pisolithus tinctorius Marx 270 TaxID=870435 RepID=A0A0C3MVY1_PISTI|nr:hypothetical protein BKA82DRAFT_1009203 [Pisolithus tinctorius]KIN93089.1 hypothetical protein M404DRAFT_1009203 [Pisolithus tinctorius Marx 270]